MTGKHLSGTPFAIHNRQKALEGLSAELFPSEVSLPNAVLRGAGNLSDEELIERERVRATVTGFDVCGPETPPITEMTIAEQTWHCAAPLPSGAGANASGLIGFSGTRASCERNGTGELAIARMEF